MKRMKMGAVLVGAMILSLLSGCGKSDNADVVKEMQKQYNKYVTLDESAYKGLTYTETHTEVTEDTINSDISNLLSQYASHTDVTDRAATWGDAVNIDYVGSVDGKEFNGGSTQGAGTQITLGSSGYIDNFDEQIVGHTPGDAFDVVVTFPDNYGVDDLNGKEATFKTTLNYIVETTTPTYTDAFVASNTDYKTTDEYETAMRKKHEEEYKESDLNTDKQNLLQQVIDAATITQYPEEEIKQRVQEVTDSMTETAQANGIDLETYLSHYGYTSDTFQAEVKSSVESYIREKMVISKISEEQNITVSEKEKEAKVQDLLGQTGLSDVDTLNKQYGYKDEDYYFMVLEDKIIDFIYTNAVAASATDATADEASPASAATPDAE